MKLIIAVLFALYPLMSVPSAEARDVPLIHLSCEDCDGVDIPLGLTVGDKNPRWIQGVYYVSNVGVRHYFDSPNLREMTPAYEMAGYDVALIQLATHARLSTATLRLRYVVNALRSTFGEIEFDLRYNAAKNRYQVIHPETNRPVSEAMIIPNTLMRRMVGIARIDLR